MSLYPNVLTTNRLRPSDVPGRTIVTESESDRGRVIFCAAFRRLQQKAQVFSMEPNAAVRSRLTHSLEVSQLGRYIADEIGVRLEKTSQLSALERSALVNFVETACLMHDIGNPPFGHFGEAAIQKWFGEKGASCVEAAIKLQHGEMGSGDPRVISALADFKEFDGNPQGLRIVARLQWKTDEHGLNLTKTTLASFLKYIRRSGEKSREKFQKKAGYFSTEEPIVQSVWREFGYSKPQRFPLAYVMEAADDIAYCVSDLEDSIEKGLVHEPSALKEIEEDFLSRMLPVGDSAYIEIVKALAAVRLGARSDGAESTYTDFRTSLNRTIVAYVADQYVKKHEEILNGTADVLLPVESPCGAILDSLKNYCRNNVYGHESIQRTELAGYTAIQGLLDHFSPLLRCSRERFGSALDMKKEDALGEPIILESKLLRLFPGKYIKVYRHYILSDTKDDEMKFKEWNARAHLITDFLSGMTDDFAMTTYRTLAGMRL
jgi:dGTPase